MIIIGLLLWSFVGLVFMMGLVADPRFNYLSTGQVVLMGLACGPVVWFFMFMATLVWVARKIKCF